jgi:hypothetical protein
VTNASGLDLCCGFTFTGFLRGLWADGPRSDTTSCGVDSERAVG